MIFQQEQARVSRASAISAQTQARLNEVMRRTDRQRKMMASLAQQGITWQQLKEAYDEAFNEGHNTNGITIYLISTPVQQSPIMKPTMPNQRIPRILYAE